MSIELATLANDMWVGVKEFIDTEHHHKIADMIVTLLMDSDVALDDIEFAFSDSAIIDAVKHYKDDVDDGEESDDDDYDDYDGYDDR